MHNIVQSAHINQLADSGEPPVLIHSPNTGNIVEIIIDQHAVIQWRRFRQIPHHLFNLYQILIQQIVFDANGPGCGHEVAREHSQSGGFSGAVGAQKAENLPFFDVEINLIHGAEVFVVFCQIFNMDHSGSFP